MHLFQQFKSEKRKKLSSGPDDRLLADDWRGTYTTDIPPDYVEVKQQQNLPLIFGILNDTKSIQSNITTSFGYVC